MGAESKVHIPWYKKCNPLWWFNNMHDPMPPESMHLWEDNPKWLRYIRWRLRNPLHNFMYYVIGVVDKDFTVTGDYPTMTWNPNKGKNRLRLESSTNKNLLLFWKSLPFVSNRGSKWEWYYGWNSEGRLGFAFRTVYAGHPSDWIEDAES